MKRIYSFLLLLVMTATIATAQPVIHVYGSGYDFNLSRTDKVIGIKNGTRMPIFDIDIVSPSKNIVGISLVIQTINTWDNSVRSKIDNAYPDGWRPQPVRRNRGTELEFIALCDSSSQLVDTGRVAIVDPGIYYGPYVKITFYLYVTMRNGNSISTYADSSSITFQDAKVLCGDATEDHVVNWADPLKYINRIEIIYGNDGTAGSIPWINVLDRENVYAGESPVVSMWLGLQANKPGYQDVKNLTDFFQINMEFDKDNDPRNIVWNISRSFAITNHQDTKVIENPSNYRVISIQGHDGNGKFFNRTYFLDRNGQAIGVAYDLVAKRLITTNSILINGRDLILLDGKYLTIDKISGTAPDIMFSFPTDILTGIEKIVDNPSFLVSPNPSNGLIRISGPDTREELIVVNSLGSTVQKIDYQGCETIWNTDIPAGVYFVVSQKYGCVAKFVRE